MVHQSTFFAHLTKPSHLRPAPSYFDISHGDCENHLKHTARIYSVQECVKAASQLGIRHTKVKSFKSLAKVPMGCAIDEHGVLFVNRGDGNVGNPGCFGLLGAHICLCKDVKPTSAPTPKPTEAPTFVPTPRSTHFPTKFVSAAPTELAQCTLLGRLNVLETAMHRNGARGQPLDQRIKALEILAAPKAEWRADLEHITFNARISRLENMFKVKVDHDCPNGADWHLSQDDDVLGDGVNDAHAKFKNHDIPVDVCPLGAMLVEDVIHAGPGFQNANKRCRCKPGFKEWIDPAERCYSYAPCTPACKSYPTMHPTSTPKPTRFPTYLPTGTPSAGPTAFPTMSSGRCTNYDRIEGLGRIIWGDEWAGGSNSLEHTLELIETVVFGNPKKDAGTFIQRTQTLESDLGFICHPHRMAPSHNSKQFKPKAKTTYTPTTRPSKHPTAYPTKKPTFRYGPKSGAPPKTSLLGSMKEAVLHEIREGAINVGTSLLGSMKEAVLHEIREARKNCDRALVSNEFCPIGHSVVSTSKDCLIRSGFYVDGGYPCHDKDCETEVLDACQKQPATADYVFGCVACSLNIKKRRYYLYQPACQRKLNLKDSILAGASGTVNSQIRSWIYMKQDNDSHS